MRKVQKGIFVLVGVVLGSGFLSAGQMEALRDSAEIANLDISKAAAVSEPEASAPRTLLIPSLSFAKVTRPFKSLDEYCVNETPISFSFVSNVPLASFWKKYEERRKAPDNADVLILELRELRQVYVAIFPTLNKMNFVLGRPTVFLTEGGLLLNHKEMVNPENFDGYVGHDLEENLLRHFAKLLMEKEEAMSYPETKEAGKNLCMEASFWEKFLWPSLNIRGNMILVAASEEYLLESTVSHEVHHAIFYGNRAFQRVVNKYWEENVSSKDRRGIIRVLKSYEYDVDNNKKLLLNEFFAYLLQIDAEEDVLSDYVKYAKDLREFLSAEGFAIPII